MALRIDGNFLAQVSNRTPQLNQPPVNTGEGAAAPVTKPQMRADTDNVRGTSGSATVPNDVQAETRQITQQRTAGTSQDKAGQQANAVAAPAWQSTMGLSLNLRAPVPAPENPRSTDGGNALGGVAVQGAGRSTLSLGVVNRTGESASSSNSTQGRTMAGEQGGPALLSRAQQLQQLADAQSAQSNARPTQRLSIMA